MTTFFFYNRQMPLISENTTADVAGIRSCIKVMHLTINSDRLWGVTCFLFLMKSSVFVNGQLLKMNSYLFVVYVCGQFSGNIQFMYFQILYQRSRDWLQLSSTKDVEVDTLTKLIKAIADVLKRRIRRLKHSVNTRNDSIFCDPEVVRELSRLHENIVIVPYADKASNNKTFVSKRYYVSISIEQLGLNSLPGNTYNRTVFLHQKCWTITNVSSLLLE